MKVVGYTVVQFKCYDLNDPENRDMVVIKSFGPDELETAKDLVELLKTGDLFPSGWVNGVYYSYNVIATQAAPEEEDTGDEKGWFTIKDNNEEEL